MTQRRKILANQIQIGKPLEFDCFDGHGILLLKKGLVVDSERTLERLLERGLFVNVDQASAEYNKKEAAASTTSPFQYFDDLNQHLMQLFTRTLLNAGEWTEDELIALNFIDKLEGIARNVQKLCEVDANAAIGLLHIDKRDRYSVFHPLHRSIVCELIGKRLGLTIAERERLICASLTCDISIIPLLDVFAKQETPLTPEQKGIILNHPIDSALMLNELGVNYKDWILAVSQHHENLNGTGYPRKLRDEEVTLWTRLISLADSYTDMIAPRQQKQVTTSQSAMRDLFLKRGSLVDENLMVLFVKEMSVFPPGTFVRLANGESAIVVRRSESSISPLVKSVIGPRGAPLTNFILRDTQVKDFSIKEVVLKDNIVRVDLHLLWDYTEGDGNEHKH